MMPAGYVYSPFMHCPGCDVEWRGPAPCWLCGNGGDRWTGSTYEWGGGSVYKASDDDGTGP